MNHHELLGSVSRRVIAGGAALLALGLLLDMYGMPSFGNRRSIASACQEVMKSEATLSKTQLAQLLTISEGDKKQRIRDIVKEPYCKLPSLQIRAGATAQREAYPLEFDRDTWLVVLYEGDQYTGYRFATQ
ncbi:hypothetical protein OsccyDRAFT_0929 [Leptolyngbyaceae cyanobacterium JSC-12]|nr:hypothetical protein OsccyDRAFT_0929 [Leptolyngbyaceae cyanobacterium JSC-12]